MVYRFFANSHAQALRNLSEQRRAGETMGVIQMYEDAARKMGATAEEIENAMRDARAASGTKTPSVAIWQEGLYYLSLNNTLKDNVSGMTYKIVGYTSIGIELEHLSSVPIHIPTINFTFADLQSAVVDKRIEVEGHLYENDRDKILLQKEINGILKAYEIEEKETMAATAAEEASRLRGALEGEKMSHDKYKKDANDTIAGMEAMASGSRAKEGVKQGGFSDGVFNTHSFQNYRHGFGWVGHELRTDALDKFTEKTFKKLGMSDREIGAFVTSRIGRKWGDALSFGKADATTQAGGIKEWFFEENSSIDEYEKNMSGGGQTYQQGCYAGKTPEQVWNSWDKKQRYHFLYDHSIPTDIKVDKYSDLEESVKQEIKGHTMMGQYAGGGSPGIHRGDLVRVVKIITSLNKEKLGKAGVVTNEIGHRLYAVKFVDGTSSGFSKKELEVTGEGGKSIPSSPSDTKRVRFDGGGTGDEKYKGMDQKEKIQRMCTEDLIFEGAFAKVIRGRYKGQIGRVVEWDDEENQVDVKMPDSNMRYLGHEDIEILASAPIDSAFSGTQIKKLTRKKNFWHARLRTPKGAKTCAVPEWAATIADTVHGGAKVTTCKFGSEWHPQKVMVPVKGVGKKEARNIAEKIAGKMQPK